MIGEHGGEVARVAELVDAQDLKSCFPQRKYGFDSRPGHKQLLPRTLSGAFSFRSGSELARGRGWNQIERPRSGQQEWIVAAPRRNSPAAISSLPLGVN